MNAWPTCVGNYQPIKTSSTHVIYLRDTSQNGGRGPTLFKFMEAVHNCPAVCGDVSSLAYKDKTKGRSALTNWASSKPFYFSTAFCFFSSFPLFHCCTWVLLHLKNGHVANYRVCYLTRVWCVKERVCRLFEVFQHEFANLSLPCEGRLTIPL